MTRTALHRSEAGYTLVELLVSTAIMLTVTGAIFSLVNPAQGSAAAQPEIADLQQRMRVSSEVLFRELMVAGAGSQQKIGGGSLLNYFAPILPRRTGKLSPDPTQGTGSFRSDAITITYMPDNSPSTTIKNKMPRNAAEVKVFDVPGCAAGKELCTFEKDMTVMIFDSLGNFDTMVLTHVQHAAGHMQHRGVNLSYDYEAGAAIMQVFKYTYFLDRTTNELKRYDGADTEEVIATDVVDLAFEYFGDPAPPTEPKPFTGAGANCLYDAAGNYKDPGTLTASDGSLANLPASILTDGPYCGMGANQFDVDLLRVRKVRVTLRLQAASPAMRGSDTALFMRPGTSKGGSTFVPDYRTVFEVAPRNLNLTR